MRNLQLLPRFGDGWTFLHVQHVRIERENHAIVLLDKQGRVSVPCAALSVLLLGPGSTLTHSAMTVLADCGCSVVWCGDGAVRFYASGVGETRRADNLMHQAAAWADASRRAEVVKRMYRMRFAHELAPDLSLEQVRGKEGVRVREAYAKASRETGVPWSGRSYNRGNWSSADPVNRALSAANACLYGLCHAAIVSTGFSPGLGFIHVGKMPSFVYDVADLYKVEVTVPVAFAAAAPGGEGIDSRARHACREAMSRTKLIERVVPDIQRALGLRPEAVRYLECEGSDEPNAEEQPGGSTGMAQAEPPGDLWDPDRGTIAGGRNFADDRPEAEP